jgi:hypothetical protein
LLKVYRLQHCTMDAWLIFPTMPPNFHWRCAAFQQMQYFYFII